LYFPEDWGGSLLPWQNEINECLINVASKADVRLSISPWLQTLLRDKHGIETQVLPNGYNPTLCNTAGLIEQAWDKRVSSPYILYVGSLFDVKNPRLFIELATRLPREQFVMIGKDLVADIVSERFEMELPRNLLLAGPQSHTATLRFIRNSQSLIVTSHSEGLPTVVMEAMALGKLVIAPNSFGCGDLLRHEENGLTYAPSDLDSLVHLVSRSSSPLLGAQAAKDAEQHYAWPSIAQRLDALYQSLLNV
jgi:glycosyltransferase involved in cell wall biosynthesis